MMRASKLAVISLVFLTGCSSVATSIAKSAIGGGPSASANVQAGKTNSQTIGQTSVQEQRLENIQADTVTQSSDDTQVKADKVERIIVNQGIHPLFWLAFVLAILVDSPRHWPEQIRDGFRRRRKRRAERSAAGR
ncbi:MAG: bacteriophage spanin2 family protein [Cognatishimia activa]